MQLIAYTPELVPTEKITAYHLPDEQLIFSALPQVAIDEAAIEPSRLPVFLEADGNFPTFMILHDQPGAQIYTDNPHALLLRSFSTDTRFQGQGYAKKTLALLPDFTCQHFPQADEIILGVNSQNNSALQLYLTSGFVDIKRPQTTDYGTLLLLSQALV